MFSRLELMQFTSVTDGRTDIQNCYNVSMIGLCFVVLLLSTWLKTVSCDQQNCELEPMTAARSCLHHLANVGVLTSRRSTGGIGSLSSSSALSEAARCFVLLYS